MNSTKLDKKLLDALRGTPLVAHTDDNKVCHHDAVSAAESNAIDDIYHSKSADEMKLKIAVRNLKLTPKNVMALIRCLAYHAAFWPHTIERYYSFLDLIDNEPILRRSICSTQVIDMLAVEIAQFITNERCYRACSERFSSGTSGCMMQFAYLQEIFSKILSYKYLNKKERSKYARIQKEVVQRSSSR